MNHEISMSRSRGRTTVMRFSPSAPAMVYYLNGSPVPLAAGQAGYLLYSLGIGFKSITSVALWGDSGGYPYSGKLIREGAAGRLANGDAVYVERPVTVEQIEMHDDGYITVKLKA